MVSSMNEEILKSIDEAFNLISSIYVKEDDVERMAAAKIRLRNAYTLAKAYAEEEKADG